MFTCQNCNKYTAFLSNHILYCSESFSSSVSNFFDFFQFGIILVSCVSYLASSVADYLV